MSGTGPGGTMPPGEGTTSGFTRFLGTDLTQRPPDLGHLHQRAGRARRRVAAGGCAAALAGRQRQRDRRARARLQAAAAAGTHRQRRRTGQVQCATCHDPHCARPTRQGQPEVPARAALPGGAADASARRRPTTSSACPATTRIRARALGPISAHAQPDVADETYRRRAAALREFPAGLPVWKAACLNCHDTHTVQGARRLTREGTDARCRRATRWPPKQGGNPAMEKTCYQCHTTAATSVLASVTHGAQHRERVQPRDPHAHHHRRAGRRHRGSARHRRQLQRPTRSTAATSDEPLRRRLHGVRAARVSRNATPSAPTATTRTAW